MNPLCVYWFRRDLRVEDNHGLHLALSSGLPVLPIFIFDECILRELPPRDARVEFIHRCLGDVPGISIYKGEPLKVWRDLLKSHNIKAVFCNEDYEPYAIERDRKVMELVRQAGAEFTSVKDQVIFAKNEVLKSNGEPYRMFTPYSRAWLQAIGPRNLTAYKRVISGPVDTQKGGGGLSLNRLRLESSGIVFPPKSIKKRNLKGLPATARPYGFAGHVAAWGAFALWHCIHPQSG